MTNLMLDLNETVNKINEKVRKSVEKITLEF
jgi:hypothetical protein